MLSVKKFILALFFIAFGYQGLVFAQEKVLYDMDMGPETPISDDLQVRKPEWKYRDHNFDELPPEADWPARHADPYPEEVIIELDRS